MTDPEALSRALKDQDVDALVGALGAPAPRVELPPLAEVPAEPEARVVPIRRRWPVLVGLAAAAAALLLLFPRGEDESEGLRGTAGLPRVSLQLVGEEDGRAVRIREGGILSPGNEVWLVARSEPAGLVQLQVEGPDGVQPLGEHKVGPEVVEDGSLPSLRLNRPGRYVFEATADPGARCRPPACARWEVEVR